MLLLLPAVSPICCCCLSGGCGTSLSLCLSILLPPAFTHRLPISPLCLWFASAAANRLWLPPCQSSSLPCSDSRVLDL